MDPDLLYYGDNLDVLRRHVKDETVDLVYLDPPFSSNANYNILFEEHGEKAAAQVQAFTDTWEWNTEARAAYEEVVEAGGKTADTMRAFRTMLGGSDMLAYLAMMAPRLVELRRVLKPTGSLFLHCDPTASHYLKLLLDAIFGPQDFRNEIAWRRTPFSGSSKARSHQLPKSHDVILFYSKGTDWTWHQPSRPYSPDYLERFKWDDGDGRGPYRKTLLKTYSKATFERLEADNRLVAPVRAGAGRSYKQYLGESRGTTQIDDVWGDINAINPVARERLGYPTQKPLALMERIIAAASSPNDVVLDPFCGCGTTVDAAQALGRRWIGIDITHLAIGLIKHRLADRYGPDIAKTYHVIGEPTTVDDARVLAAEDPFQFQAWALGLAGARIAGSDKKGGDKGIDGRLYFHDAPGGPTRQIVLSVKAGRLVPAYVRDLHGVLDREGAEIGVLVTFEAPSAGMKAEAAEAGFYASAWGKHPRLQLRTVGELLEGRGIDYPHVTGANITHRRAARATTEQGEALELFAAEEPAPYRTDSEG